MLLQAAEEAAAQKKAAEAAAKEPYPARLSTSAAAWQQQCAERLKAAQVGVGALLLPMRAHIAGSISLLHMQPALPQSLVSPPQPLTSLFKLEPQCQFTRPLHIRVQESVRPFVEDRAMRDKKRSIDKFVTLNVQQVSATLDQVRRAPLLTHTRQGSVGGRLSCPSCPGMLRGRASALLPLWAGLCQWLGG